MIEIIVKLAHTAEAIHVGGPVVLKWVTFDVEAPEIEKEIATLKERGWTVTEVVGAIADKRGGE